MAGTGSAPGRRANRSPLDLAKAPTFAQCVPTPHKPKVKRPTFPDVAFQVSDVAF